MGKKSSKSKQPDMNGLPQVALEDLVTLVISEFFEHAKDLGWDPLVMTVQAWYGVLKKKERFKLADKLLDIMKKEEKK